MRCSQHGTNPTKTNHPPVLDSIGPQRVLLGNTLTLRVHATDPDGTVPSLKSLNPPSNLAFADSGNGSGAFTFSPDYPQVGTLEITVIACDSSLADSEQISVTVTKRTATTWIRVFGEQADYRAFGAVATGGNGLIVGGQLTSRLGIRFFKVDLSGNVVWTRDLSEKGYWMDMAHTPDEGFILCGSTDDDRMLPRSFGRTLKVDSLGNREWGGTAYTESDNDNALYSVCSTPDGGYVFLGWRATGGMTTRMTKTNSNGFGQWAREFPSGGYSWGNDAIVASEGGYAITGAASTDSAGQRIFLNRIDAAGTTVWEKMYGDSHSDQGFAIAGTSDGGFIVAGSTMPAGSRATDFLLIRVDASGTEVWKRTLGGFDADTPTGITKTADGNFVVYGGTRSFGSGGWDIYLVKIDPNGNKLWERTFGGDNDESVASVVLASDGGFFIAGTTTSFRNGRSDIYLIKTDAQGIVDSTSTSM